MTCCILWKWRFIMKLTNGESLGDVLQNNGFLPAEASITIDNGQQPKEQNWMYLFRRNYLSAVLEDENKLMFVGSSSCRCRCRIEITMKVFEDRLVLDVERIRGCTPGKVPSIIIRKKK